MKSLSSLNLNLKRTLALCVVLLLLNADRGMCRVRARVGSTALVAASEGPPVCRTPETKAGRDWTRGDKLDL